MSRKTPVWIAVTGSTAVFLLAALSFACTSGWCHSSAPGNNGGADAVLLAALSFAGASGWCQPGWCRIKSFAMPRHITIGRIPHGDEPLAYLLTWTTYGTWLPGDERGWVEKPGQFREPDIERQRQALMRMTESAIVLDAEQRAIVESVIKKHCEIRKWTLHAAGCRTNHVHVVVTADRHPDVILDQLKSWCTRRLKEDQRTRHPQ